jgi:DNA/RNA-binding domain of Phe-tRNA-synthetase-like protein
MIPIEIEKSLQGTIKVGALHFKGLNCHSENNRIWEEIEVLGRSYRQKYSEPSQALEILRPARDLYRKIGVEPTKTRPSSEALVRRAIMGKSLYHVNSIVDVGNLCSLSFLLPIGLYDLAKIEEFIILRKGEKGEEYKGIGKEMIHVEGRYTLADKNGAFGNPSSDSLRTSIDSCTRDLLFVIFAPFAYPDYKLQTHNDFAEQKMLQFHQGNLVNKKIGI